MARPSVVVVVAVAFSASSAKSQTTNGQTAFSESNRLAPPPLSASLPQLACVQLVACERRRYKHQHNKAGERETRQGESPHFWFFPLSTSRQLSWKKGRRKRERGGRKLASLSLPSTSERKEVEELGVCAGAGLFEALTPLLLLLFFCHPCLGRNIRKAEHIAGRASKLATRQKEREESQAKTKAS